LITGLAFLPIPASVFLSSQLTSRVLVNRVPPKSLMLTGITISMLSLLISSRLHAGAGYPQIVAGLMLLGVGSGISLVSLTSAALTGVAPQDAGAASGVINVMQQTGAAFGLAVLVTVFEGVTSPARSAALSSKLGARQEALLIHGLDVTFLSAALFALVALVIVALVVRSDSEPGLSAELEVELAA